eukprot:gene14251-16819_t
MTQYLVVFASRVSRITPFVAFRNRAEVESTCKFSSSNMTNSRVLRQKADKYHNNIEKRGKVETKKKEDGLGISPYVLAFIVFVVVGSSLLQIFKGQ